jgi:hypothetical protein
MTQRQPLSTLLDEYGEALGCPVADLLAPGEVLDLSATPREGLDAFPEVTPRRATWWIPRCPRCSLHLEHSEPCWTDPEDNAARAEWDAADLVKS